MIKAIIIDDEPYCSELLSILLEQDCKDVQILTICSNPRDGIAAIQQHSPDLVFLDIAMPGMNGFEMLEKLPGFNFHLVVTTSYDMYAVKAIRHSALDFLMKPVDRQELIEAVGKVREKLNAPLPPQLETLLEKMRMMM